jgi:hypothetical protein
MRVQCKCLPVVLLAICLLACVDLSGLRDALANPCGSGGCQIVTPTCDQVDAFSWLIRGFDFGDLASPCTGSECIVELRVGDTRQLVIEGAHFSRVDCTGAITSANWGTATDGVIELEALASTRALLTATHTGETSIFADLQFATGQQKRAHPHVSAIRIVTVRVSSR